MSQSTFSWEEPLASPSPSQDSEADWRIRVAAWPSSFFDLLAAHAPAGWFGRMSPVSCQRIVDGRWEPLSGGLAELGYGFAWRVLDAQYFGLAQRRKRLFVVGCLGDWRGAAAVLFERACLRGDPAPSREKGAQVASPVAGGTPGSGGHRLDADRAADLIPELAYALSAGQGNRFGSGRDRQDTFIPFVKAKRAQSNRDDETWEPGRPAPTLNAFDQGDARATVCIVNSHNSTARKDHARESEIARAVDTTGGYTAGQGGTVVTRRRASVRRLTPTECERLQGFPDGYTDILFRGKPATDSHRYRALGNSMAVPVMAWIGRRIAAVEALK